jgi:cytochrome c-type biogenesis protein CcmE
MDPSRKRAIRLTVALTAAVVLAVALIYTSFSAGRDEVTASQLIAKAKPGTTYILAGTVLDGSVHETASEVTFRIRDPKQDMSVPVVYKGSVPDPFAAGRAVLVDVKEGTSPNSSYIGQGNSLTTKCPSKYKAISGSYKSASSLKSAAKAASSSS